jgi:hypothetical protein
MSRKSLRKSHLDLSASCMKHPAALAPPILGLLQVVHTTRNASAAMSHWKLLSRQYS